MELMEKLLETNTVWQRPSGTVDGDKVDTWMGGIPESFSEVQVTHFTHSSLSLSYSINWSEVNECCIIKGWQPDPERLAEKVIGLRSEEILKGILNDLQVSFVMYYLQDDT